MGRMKQWLAVLLCVLIFLCSPARQALAADTGPSKKLDVSAPEGDKPDPKEQPGGEEPEARLEEPEVVAVPGSGKVSLSWDAVSGAENYTVKRSEEETGGYTELAATGECSFEDAAVLGEETYYYTDAAVSQLQTYYYKVEAVCSRQAGLVSAKSRKSKAVKAKTRKIARMFGVKASNCLTGSCRQWQGSMASITWILPRCWPMAPVTCRAPIAAEMESIGKRLRIALC